MNIALNSGPPKNLCWLYHPLQDPGPHTIIRKPKLYEIVKKYAKALPEVIFTFKMDTVYGLQCYLWCEFMELTVIALLPRFA